MKHIKHTNENACPTICPSCGVFVFAPPCWLKLLVALAPVISWRYKTGIVGMKVGTQSQISRTLHITRERVRQMVVMAQKHKVLDTPYPGNTIYCLSKWGRLLLRWWIVTGWRPNMKLGKYSQLAARARGFAYSTRRVKRIPA